MIRRPRLSAFGRAASRASRRSRLGLVHAGGGLVEQKEGRRRRERAGDLDAALVAIAEAAGEVVGAAGEAELGEQPVGEPAAPPAARGRCAIAPASTFSRTVRLRNRRTIWNERAMPRAAILRGGRPVMSSPLHSTRPS